MSEHTSKPQTSQSNIKQPGGLGCDEIEVLLADYLDEILDPGHRAAVKQHLDACPGCAQFSEDIAMAMGLVEKSAAVEAPPELVNKLLFEVTEGSSRAVVRPSWAVRVAGRMFGRWLEPILQPRFAMGMAMTVLSLGMLLRFEAVRQITTEDLQPTQLFAAAEDKVAGWWDGAVRSYENLRVVFEIEAMYQDWMEQRQAADDSPAPAAPENGTATDGATGDDGEGSKQ